MGSLAICAFFVASFCWIAICEANPFPKPNDNEPTSLVGRLGGFEPQVVAGTGILGSTYDKNGKDNRNIVKSVESGVAGSGSITKTANDANLKVTKDEDEQGTTEMPDEGLQIDKDEIAPPPSRARQNEKSRKSKNKNRQEDADEDDDEPRGSKRGESGHRRHGEKKKSRRH